MMPYKPFVVLQPKNLAMLIAKLPSIDDKTKIIAGGTDIMPNVKNGLYDIDRVIAINKIPELKQWIINDDTIELGAGITLDYLEKNPTIKALLPSLAQASHAIASPPIRSMATLGGNICLETRCLYYNQSHFYRNALGYCLKKDGDICHVTKTGKRCVAASSNDLATVLLSLDASLTIIGPEKKRHVFLRDFYVNDGIAHTSLHHQEIISSVVINISSRSHTGFFKLRHRNSIDFPLLSVAVSYKLDEDQRFLSGSLVVNALVAKPKVVDLAEFIGQPFSPHLMHAIATRAQEKCHPQTSICDHRWRKDMVGIATLKALENARG